MARVENDFYPTPEYATKVLLENHSLWTQSLLEPCVGSGDIIAHIRKKYPNISWSGGDIVEREMVPGGRPEFTASHRDFQMWNCVMGRSEGVITNPPYSQAFEVAKHFVEGGWPLVALLLRVTFAGSQVRNKWLRAHTPSVYIVPRRFRQRSGNGKIGGDNVERAWFVWDETILQPRFAIGEY